VPSDTLLSPLLTMIRPWMTLIRPQKTMIWLEETMIRPSSIPWNFIYPHRNRLLLMVFLLINGGVDIVEVIGSTPTDPTKEKVLWFSRTFLFCKIVRLAAFSPKEVKKNRKVVWAHLKKCWYSWVFWGFHLSQSLKNSLYLCPCFFHLFYAHVCIPLHGHAHIRMPGDALKRLDIHTWCRRQCDKCIYNIDEI